MKPKFLSTLLLLLLSATALRAQTYVGTMTIGDYERIGVTVSITPGREAGTVLVTMYRVKFAKMMPVKVDLTLYPITKNGNRLVGNNITPVYKDKRYEKHMVRDLFGTVEADSLQFGCQMGKKQLTFNGKRI